MSEHERYFAALSNAFTIAAENGMIAMMGYLLITFLPMLLVSVIVYPSGGALPSSMAAAMLSFQVSSLFSYLIPSVGVLITASVIYGAGVIFCIPHVLKKFPYLTISVGFSICAFLCVASFLWGKVGQRERVRSEMRTSTSNPQFEVEAVPQAGSSTSIVYFCSKNDTLYSVARGIARPLAQKGYAVYSIPYFGSGGSALKENEELLKKLRSNGRIIRISYFVGREDGGRMAILIGEKNEMPPEKGIVAIGPQLEWPMRNLSPIDNLITLQVPLLLLVDSEGNDLTSISAFVDTAKKLNKPVKIQTIKFSGELIISNWITPLITKESPLFSR